MKMHDYEVTENVSNIGMTVFSILAVVSLVLCVIYLIGMAMYSVDVSHGEKYTEIKYQEYLIKNPGHELYIGDKQLNKYESEKFSTPIVLALKTDGGHKYEVFVDNSGKSELIGNELLVFIDSS